MTAYRPHDPADRADASSPIEQVMQLTAILSLVEEMAGGKEASAAIPLSDERQVREARDRAPDIARYRFDMLIAQGAAMATGAVRPLLERKAHPAAATRLAEELRGMLQRAGAAIGL